MKTRKIYFVSLIFFEVNCNKSFFKKFFNDKNVHLTQILYFFVVPGRDAVVEQRCALAIGPTFQNC